MTNPKTVPEYIDEPLNIGHTRFMKTIWLRPRNLVIFFVLALLLSTAVLLTVSKAQAAQKNLPATVFKPLALIQAEQQDLNAIVEEIQVLIDAWQGEALLASGWLRVVELHDRTKDTAGPLPSGADIPIDYISDTWYHLDGGELVELVALMKDLDENVVQASTYRDGIWRNLTFGEEWQAQADPVTLDYGFVRDILNSPLYGSLVERDENEAEIIFSIRDLFEQPVRIEGYDFMVVQGVRRLVFDKTTGAVLTVERIFESESGVQHLVEQITILRIERDTPPSDVLRFFEGS